MLHVLCFFIYYETIDRYNALPTDTTSHDLEHFSGFLCCYRTAPFKLHLQYPALKLGFCTRLLYYTTFFAPTQYYIQPIYDMPSFNEHCLRCTSPI